MKKRRGFHHIDENAYNSIKNILQTDFIRKMGHGKISKAAKIVMRSCGTVKRVDETKDFAEYKDSLARWYFEKDLKKQINGGMNDKPLTKTELEARDDAEVMPFEATVISLLRQILAELKTANEGNNKRGRWFVR